MALRKLQAEIDRTLKSVAQGVEVFESTFDKMNMSSSTTQKDKLENDLKTQIKKLQRMRDQIKAWLGNGDIKDKTALLDNRKLIETQMERFKALEKEMKMKAFSKEGLIAQNKLDPAEKAKREMIDWVGNTTDELSRQIEQTEAEAENLQNTRKKKQSGDRLGELEELNDRRQWHIGRLEVVQRMLENGQLQVEQVEDIQEDVKYFLEANNEEDFDFDQGIYDELNLQEEEDYVHDFAHLDDDSHLDTASLVDATEISTPAPKTPAKEEPAPISVSASVSKKNTPASKNASSSQHDDTPPSPVSTKKTPSRKTTLESKATPKAAETVPPVPPVPAPAPATTAPAPTPKAALPPIRYAAAAAAAVAGSTPAASAPTQAQADLSPQKAKEPLPTPTPSSVVETPLEKAPSPAKVESPEAVTPSPSKANGAQTNGHPPPPPPGLASSKSPVPSHQASTEVPTPAAQPIQAPAPVGYAPQHAESSRAAAAQLPTPSQTPAQPGVMGNLMHSFEVAKEISKRRTNDVHELNSALDGSFSNIPQQADAEPPRYYHPKHPVKTPSYYPQARIPIIEDKNLYPRLDLDQLFYIFYYMTGTYEQWLAAQELKRQSWRFHKQYLTWFQRAHNPQAITEDYEQGGYYYFDWENSWCQRRKSDFRFEYRWLSDH